MPAVILRKEYLRRPSETRCPVHFGIGGLVAIIQGSGTGSVIRAESDLPLLISQISHKCSKLVKKMFSSSCHNTKVVERTM